MNHAEEILLENIRHQVTESLQKDNTTGNEVAMMALFAKALPLIKPGTGLQHDIIEKIIEIAPYSSKTAPAETLETLSKCLLWVGNEYIPHFASSILILEKPAIDINPEQALAAIEQSLMVCYSIILPQNIHGTGRCNDRCIEWQRYTFLSVINAIETKSFIDPSVSSSILHIAETMTGSSAKLQDIHERIKFLAHIAKPEHLSWH